jgi:hypothetical protein
MCLTAIVLLLRTGSMPAGAAQFPKVILACFIGFGLWIAYKGVVKTRLLKNDRGDQVKDKPLDLTQLKRPFLTLAGVIMYVAAIKLAGFFVASTAFVLVFMWFSGIRSIKKMLLITLGMDIFLYLLFVIQLKVQLPSGMLNLI